MGSPRKLKKQYSRPFKPYEKGRIAKEKELIKQYGLRRKKEIWRAESMLREIRRRVRKLIATKNAGEEKNLIEKVSKMGFTSEKSSLDDLLDLNVKNVFNRRLQTMLVEQNLANTTKQARQFITHGHIAVGGVRVTSPSYLVKLGGENSISFIHNSKLNATFQKASDKKSKTEKTETKTEKVKAADDSKNNDLDNPKEPGDDDVKAPKEKTENKDLKEEKQDDEPKPAEKEGVLNERQ